VSWGNPISSFPQKRDVTPTRDPHLTHPNIKSEVDFEEGDTWKKKECHVLSESSTVYYRRFFEETNFSYPQGPKSLGVLEIQRPRELYPSNIKAAGNLHRVLRSKGVSSLHWDRFPIWALETGNFGLLLRIARSITQVTLDCEHQEKLEEAAKFRNTSIRAACDADEDGLKLTKRLTEILRQTEVIVELDLTGPFWLAIFLVG